MTALRIRESGELFWEEMEGLQTEARTLDTGQRSLGTAKHERSYLDQDAEPAAGATRSRPAVGACCPRSKEPGNLRQGQE